MLKQAVQARLPLIAVTTRDTVYAVEVIKRVIGAEVKVWGNTPNAMKPEKGVVYVWFPPKGSKLTNLTEVYLQFSAAAATMILVNGTMVDDTAFDAGELETPRSMKQEFLTKAGVDAKRVPDMLSGLGNTTLKETGELLRLTMARDKSATVGGLLKSRKEFFRPQDGLTQVLGDQPFYDPPEELAAYVEREREFFLEEDDVRLRPRGILFDGPPGTGKTAGAKYIAAKWGVPLYRVDVGGTQSKWVGESERNMIANLARLDREEPCVALFDEVEKSFRQGDHESTITGNIKAQLLWWLAEHTSRVFVVMTTNKVKAIPPELHRERRIDQTMVLNGLPTTSKACAPFVEQLLATFGITRPAGDPGKGAQLDAAIQEILEPIIGGADKPPFVAQATLTEAVYLAIKRSRSGG